RSLIEALQQYGHNAEALRLILQLVKRQDTAQNEALLARCYEHIGAPRAAARTFLKSLARFGSTARLGNQPGELSRTAVSAGLGAEVAAALEKQLAGKQGPSPLRVDLALLYRALGRYADAGREYGRLLEALPA